MNPYTISAIYIYIARNDWGHIELEVFFFSNLSWDSSPFLFLEQKKKNCPETILLNLYI